MDANNFYKRVFLIFCMDKEYAVVIVKPEFLDKKDKVLSLVDKLLENDFERGKEFLIQPRKEQVDKHCGHVKEKYPYVYEDYMEAWPKKQCCVMLYYGNNIVGRLRDAVGCTNPAEAESHTVRAVFSSDSMEVSTRERRAVRNVIHVSDSYEASFYEKENWLAELGI